MQKTFLLFLSTLLFFLFSFSNNILSQYFEIENRQPVAFSVTSTPDNPELPSKYGWQEASFAKVFKAFRNNPDYSWQLPLLTGNRLTGIVHITNDIVMVCGGHGTILKSDNGGEDWEKIEPVST